MTAKTAIVTIDTLGMDAGSAFAYAKGIERLDGRLGRTDGGWYFETYNSEELGGTTEEFGNLYATGATRLAVVRKVAKMLGYDTVDFRYER